MGYVQALTPKERNLINDINQVVKKSFLHYFILEDGLVMSNPKGFAIEKGFHFSLCKKFDVIKNLIPIPEKHILVISAQNMFVTFRDRKKEIEQIMIENNVVFVGSDSVRLPIGKLVERTPSIDSMEQKIHNFLGYVDVEGRIPDESVDKMLENEIITFEKGKYKIRLTKELFPHIKKGIDLNVSFIETGDPYTFKTLLSVDKGNVQNYHLFDCIYY